MLLLIGVNCLTVSHKDVNMPVLKPLNRLNQMLSDHCLKVRVQYMYLLVLSSVKREAAADDRSI